MRRGDEERRRHHFIGEEGGEVDHGGAGWRGPGVGDKYFFTLFIIYFSLPEVLEEDKEALGRLLLQDGAQLVTALLAELRAVRRPQHAHYVQDAPHHLNNKNKLIKINK